MHPTKQIMPFFLVLLFLLGSTSLAWSTSSEKQAVLAILSFNVANFTTWPEQAFAENESLTLCIFGSNIVQESFSSIHNRKVKGRKIKVVNLLRLRNLERCQLLYLSDVESTKLIPLLKEIKDQPILTIGENKRFLNAGGMVSLEKIKGKMQIDVCLPRVKTASLVISSRLLKLANIVNCHTPIKK